MVRLAGWRTLLVLMAALHQCFAVDMSAPGPFQVGWQKMMMKPPSGLEFDSIIVYPSEDVGWQAPPDTKNGPYPVLVFGHGYSTEPDSYMSTLQHLASWGYIVAAPEVPALHHLRYANEMSTCFTHLEKINVDPHSPFHGLIDHKHYGIFGHTAGAGAAIVAAAKDPRIRCVAALAPVDTMPSSILTIKKVHVPVNIIVAKDDWLASADKNSVPIYKNAHAPKQFHILSGGGNAYFYDGEGVHRQRQLRISRFFLTTWFNLYLRQDVHMWPYVWGDNVWNDTVVFSVHDRGNPMDLARRKTPTDSTIIQLEEESSMHNPLTFDPRNPRSFQKDFSKPGPHKVATTNLTTTDRDGTMFSASIYYPSTEEGIGTPIDLDGAPYPALVFAHGWFQVPESYATTLQHLASFGYVIVCSRASQELFADKFAAELTSIMNWMQAEAVRNGSDWFQTVDATKFGLMGHSIGGGVSLIAAANDPRVKAIVVMAPSQTHHPSAFEKLPYIHAPTCFICADDEEVGDNRLQSIPLYNKANYPKVLHQFLNGSNTFFSDGMLLGSQHRSQLKNTQDLSRAFFDLYLKGDTRKGYEGAWRQVWGSQALNISKVVHMVDAGFRLSVMNPSPHLETVRGTACDFELMVNNSSPITHVFDIFVEDNSWPVEAPARTGKLRPRQSASFHVTITPTRKTRRAIDRIVVSVRSDTDGYTRQSVELECSIPLAKVNITAKQLPKRNATANATANSNKTVTSNTTTSNTTSATDSAPNAADSTPKSSATGNDTSTLQAIVPQRPTPGFNSTVELSDIDDIPTDDNIPSDADGNDNENEMEQEEGPEPEGPEGASGVEDELNVNDPHRLGGTDSSLLGL